MYKGPEAGIVLLSVTKGKESYLTGAKWAKDCLPR